ncbi:hypothetical protein NUSPORA_00501 [Nucleospora cyclopteri]
MCMLVLLYLNNFFAIINKIYIFYSLNFNKEKNIKLKSIDMQIFELKCFIQ